MARTYTGTFEARIWKVADYGNGPLVTLWMGQRDGDRRFRTLIPLSDADQRTYSNITIKDDVIVGIATMD